jgi:nicotinamidase-related amidase
VLKLDPKTTALVLIDLQKGIASRPLEPRTGEQVVVAAAEFAKRCRSVGTPVVLVNVAFAKDLADAIRVPVDRPLQPPPGGFPDNFSELVDGLAAPGDIRVTKWNWGAFYGTDLDVQLRRRGIRTIALGGISTNIGVESTARQAWERNYEIVIAEDITATRTAEMQDFALTSIFPLISRVSKTSEIQFGG